MNIRPTTFKEYIGQENLKNKLCTYIKSSVLRNKTLDHTLLYGSPGVGKTSLAYVIANELKVNIKVVNAPLIEKPGDIAFLLSGLEYGDILFIDEIHRLSKEIEEVLYSAMEDFKIDIQIGDINNRKIIRIDVEPFTLIGATTKLGNISKPLRDRFGIIERIDDYKIEDIVQILKNNFIKHGFNAKEEALYEIAKRSRAIPRLANNMLSRIIDFAIVDEIKIINIDNIHKYMNYLEINDIGLTTSDIKYLKMVYNIFSGGPVGLDSLAISLNEDKETIVDFIEPYLVQQQLIKRTSRGRVLTEKAINIVK